MVSSEQDVNFYSDVETSILGGEDIHIKFTLSIMNRIQFLNFICHAITHLSQDKVIKIIETLLNYRLSRNEKSK